MHFDQTVSGIIDFLPESQGALSGIDLLDVAGAPAEPAGDIQPVAAPTIRKFLPIGELTFVLDACAHDKRSSLYGD